MNKLTLASLLLSLCLPITSIAAQQDSRCYELRIYYAPPGKLDALNARFRNHTLKLFEKHGMANIGYWVPVENPDNRLIYIVAHASRDAATKSWKAFFSDPEWQSVVKASEANGKLVSKMVSIFLKPTDYSPAIKPVANAQPRLFELRTYKAPPGKLDALNARFRDHTLKLFEKHGISNFGYWMPTDAKDGAGDTLIYIVAHKDREAADASWKAFRADPDWVQAKAASEVNGPLTAKAPESVYMLPTDYSPTK